MIGTATVSLAATRGSVAPVLDNCEAIDMAVRMVERRKPVFVSTGYRVIIKQAVTPAFRAFIDHRITGPLWQAYRVSRECRKNPADEKFWPVQRQISASGSGVP